jgi:hypothetical protein
MFTAKDFERAFDGSSNMSIAQEIEELEQTIANEKRELAIEKNRDEISHRMDFINALNRSLARLKQQKASGMDSSFFEKAFDGDVVKLNGEAYKPAAKTSERVRITSIKRSGAEAFVISFSDGSKKKVSVSEAGRVAQQYGLSPTGFRNLTEDSSFHRAGDANAMTVKGFTPDYVSVANGYRAVVTDKKGSEVWRSPQSYDNRYDAMSVAAQRARMMAAQSAGDAMDAVRSSMEDRKSVV